MEWMTINHGELLAQIYALILAWPDNEITPDDAANDNQGQLGNEGYSSFSSHSRIAKSRGGSQREHIKDD